AAGGDGDALVLGVGGRDQVVAGEADGALGVVVAVDLDVGGVPALPPCGDVVGDHGVRAAAAEQLEVVGGGRLGVVRVARGEGRDEAIQAVDAADADVGADALDEAAAGAGVLTNRSDRVFGSESRGGGESDGGSGRRGPEREGH